MIYKIIVTPHASGSVLKFQEIFNFLISQGVPANQIVDTWNRCQTNFYDKIFLVEEDEVDKVSLK